MSARSILPAGARIVLTPQAQAIMDQGFAAGLAAEEISRRLAQIGTRISSRTVARRRAEARMLIERAQVIAQLAQLDRSTWGVDEILRIVHRVDTAPGWYRRARLRLRRAVSRFLREPGEAEFRELADICISYAIGSNMTHKPRLVRKQERGESQRAV
jgi:hypothetical protein